MSSGDWGTRWLELAEQSPAFDDAALRRGADYAAFDWQLDLDIEEGQASVLASSGRRMQYKATITIPTLTEGEIDTIVTSIAGETERLAAVLDGELPDHLDSVLAIAPDSIHPSCSCQSVDQPCKHASAVVHLIADAIADEPFDLLHLRGLSRTELIRRLTAVRRGDQPSDVAAPEAPTGATTDEPDDRHNPPAEEPAPLIWNEGTGQLPDDVDPPDQPSQLPPFPTPPPPGASFHEAGLQTLADDAARRAHAALTSGLELASGNENTLRWHDLDATSDLARRAADTEDSKDWKALVAQSDVSSQELRARATAWRTGGPTAVEAHIAPAEVVTEPDNPDQQLRRTHEDVWVRFEKVKGRWLARGIQAG